MAARKEIKSWSFPDFDKPDWFLLNSTPKKRREQYWHEVAAADIFAAYIAYLSGRHGGWGYEPQVGKERADRGMHVKNIAYIEVDMCAAYRSEPIEDIYEKIDQYVDYAEESGELFHLIFDFVGDEKKAQERLGRTLAYAATKKRHGQILATTHQHIESNPFGAIYFSPEMEFLTIKQLLEDVI